MTDMPPDPQHARTRDRVSSVVATAYAVLIWAGVSSVAFNIVHAFRHGSGNPLLPGLYGIGPAFVAVCLSHIAAEGRTGKILRAAVVVIMLASMAGSIGATADVAAPFAGLYLAWLYGLILDAAALAALRVILSDRNSKRDEATALESAVAEAAAARHQASEATGKAAALETQLAGVRAELEAALARTSAPRKSRRSAPRKPARNKAPVPPGTSAPEVPGADDLSTEVQALDILQANPGISGSELGRRLGKTDRYGRELIKRLAPVAASSGPESADQS